MTDTTLSQAIKEAFTDGAQEMYDEVAEMQRYAYLELANEPHSEIILQTLDSVVAGLAVTLGDLRDKERELG